MKSRLCILILCVNSFFYSQVSLGDEVSKGYKSTSAQFDITGLATDGTCEINHNKNMTFDFGEVDPEKLTGDRPYSSSSSLWVDCGDNGEAAIAYILISGNPGVGFSTTNILATSTDGLGIALEQGWIPGVPMGGNNKPITINQPEMVPSENISGGAWFLYGFYLVKKAGVTLSPGPFNATATMGFFYN